VSNSVRTHVQVEVDRERLIDECLAFVRSPRSPERQRAVKNGPIPTDLLEVLALEGATRRSDVARAVALLDGVRWEARWDYAG
jgi:hypothetical protein